MDKLKSKYSDRQTMRSHPVDTGETIREKGYVASDECSVHVRVFTFGEFSLPGPTTPSGLKLLSYVNCK